MVNCLCDLAATNAKTQRKTVWKPDSALSLCCMSLQPPAFWDPSASEVTGWMNLLFKFQLWFFGCPQSPVDSVDSHRLWFIFVFVCNYHEVTVSKMINSSICYLCWQSGKVAFAITKVQIHIKIQISNLPIQSSHQDLRKVRQGVRCLWAPCADTGVFSELYHTWVPWQVAMLLSTLYRRLSAGEGFALEPGSSLYCGGNVFTMILPLYFVFEDLKTIKKGEFRENRVKNSSEDELSVKGTSFSSLWVLFPPDFVYPPFSLFASLLWSPA